MHVSPHPLVAHKLRLLRRVDTEPKKFRELVRELGGLLAYEATLDLKTRPVEVQTPLTTPPARSWKKKSAGAILRAGWYDEGVWELMSSAEVWHIGIYRRREHPAPVEYYNKLPLAPTVQVC